MLDALAFADAQARLTAAGREVRAEAEKLLPQPTQRKALEDEMLRWYQSHVPPEDGPRDPAAPAPRPGAARQSSPSGDPGF